MSEQKHWKRGKFYTIADEIMGKPAQFRATTEKDLESATNVDEHDDEQED